MASSSCTNCGKPATSICGVQVWGIMCGAPLCGDCTDLADPEGKLSHVHGPKPPKKPYIDYMGRVVEGWFEP